VFVSGTATGGTVGAGPASGHGCQCIQVTKETVMAKKVNEKQNPRAGVASKQDRPDPEITGLSPDDDVGVKSDDTGKPGAPEK
jgi:hypothetical protein